MQADFSSAGLVLKIRLQLMYLVEPGSINFVGVMPFSGYLGSNRSEVLLILKLMLGKMNKSFYFGGTQSFPILTLFNYLMSMILSIFFL